MNVHLFRVKKVWHYRFQVAGARVQRSTGETVKHRAETIAEKAFRRAKLWAHGEEPVPTLREVVVTWLAAHVPIASSAHIKSIETFGRLHLYELGDVPLDELTTEQVEDARLAHLKDHAPASANHWLRALKVVCNWAVRRKIIPELPWQVTPLKVQKRPRTILPVPLAVKWLEDVDRISRNRPGIALAVRLMFGMGLRESETITARWEWLDWERRTYTPGITKGREADPVPMPAWLLDYLRPLRQPAGLIVLNRAGKPFGRGFTRAPMLEANKVCGIEGLTAHRLRGSFATLMSEQGVPVQTVQKVLRHKDSRTTMGYLESNLDLVVQAQARLGTSTGLSASAKPEQSGEKVANDAL